MTSPDLCVSILGTGSFLPPQRADNSTVLGYLGVDKEPSWVEERFGIVERRLAFDFARGCKPVREEGGFFDTDLAERASRCALDTAGIPSEELDALVFVTCTPDKLHFMYPAIELHRRLGLRRNAHTDHVNSGCAGLAKAFVLSRAYMLAGMARNVLVVASNTPSSFFVEPHRYVRTRSWLSAVVFGDGAGAVVLGRAAGDEQAHGFTAWCEADGAHPLMDFPAGGALLPTTAETLDQHVYRMDAKEVAAWFQPAMERNVVVLAERDAGALARARRVYVHQANRWLVEAFANAARLPSGTVPVNVDRYGNTSAASTLILLDEDVHAGIVKPDDTVVFLWVGAGMLYGGATVPVRSVRSVAFGAQQVAERR